MRLSGRNGMTDPFRHGKELDDPAIRFGKHLFSVVKIRVVIARDTESETEVSGLVCLCRDLQSTVEKTDLLMTSLQACQMTAQEILTLCERYGIFAIAATRDLSADQMLPELFEVNKPPENQRTWG